MSLTITANDVTSFMEEYFHKLHTFEVSDPQVMAMMTQLETQGQEGMARSITAMHEQIAKKKAVYCEFWSRADDYWEPCSLTDRSHHDWSRVTVLGIHSNGLDCFAFRYEYDLGMGVPCEYVMLVKLIENKLRIVDHLF